MIVTQGVGSTDQGLVREHNEDALLIDEGLALYAVADGMGGAKGGEVAARMALNTLEEGVRAAAQAISIPLAEASPRWLETRLRRAVEAASDRVYQAAQADLALHGMGCTLTVVWVAGVKAIVAHVGDSRLYLVRDGVCHVLTRDHTFVQELREQGWAEAELEAHPYSHVLVRAIGTQPAVVVDTTVIDLMPGDRLLLCTDGLTGYVPAPLWVAEQVSGSDPAEVVRRLIAFANESGGVDNTAAVVVEAVADPADPQRALRFGRVTLRNLRTLGGMPLLEGLSLAHTSEVLKASEIRSFEAGAVVLTKGEALRGIYVVLDGELAIRRGELIVHRVPVGRWVGDEALVQPRLAEDDVVATAPSSVLCFSCDHLKALSAARPALGVALLWRLAARLAGAPTVPSPQPRIGGGRSSRVRRNAPPGTKLSTGG